jgi:hypothetical protein
VREIIREEDRSKETRKWVSTQERIGRKEEIYDTQEEHVLNVVRPRLVSPVTAISNRQ